MCFKPTNYQYTSHVAGKRFSLWNWSVGASLVDINHRCLTNTHWSDHSYIVHILKDVHSCSTLKSAGALIETPSVSSTDSSHRILCQGFSVTATLRNQYTAACSLKNNTHWLKEHLQCMWRLWKSTGHILLMFFKLYVYTKEICWIWNSLIFCDVWLFRNEVFRQLDGSQYDDILQISTDKRKWS